MSAKEIVEAWDAARAFLEIRHGETEAVYLTAVSLRNPRVKLEGYIAASTYLPQLFLPVSAFTIRHLPEDLRLIQAGFRGSIMEKQQALDGVMARRNLAALGADFEEDEINNYRRYLVGDLSANKPRSLFGYMPVGSVAIDIPNHIVLYYNPDSQNPTAAVGELSDYVGIDPDAVSRYVNDINTQNPAIIVTPLNYQQWVQSNNRFFE